MLNYKRKLILTKAQEKRIDSWIGACRIVYNMGLEIRIAAWTQQKNVHKFELMNQLTTIKDIDWIKDVPAHALQSVIQKLDSSYKNFYNNYKTGAGFPRFATKKRYKSISFMRQHNKPSLRINDNKIMLPNLGWVNMFKDSKINGIIKMATVKKEINGYFIYIVCDNARTIQNKDESQVCGIDMGIAYFCVDSKGDLINNLKLTKKYEKKVRIEGRSLSRKIKFSNRWKKQSRKLSILHRKIADIRHDFLHKESTKLAIKYHTIYVEELNLNNMIKNKQLSKHILDCGWGIFRSMLEYKTNVVRVDPRYTSQVCNECGVKDSTSRISQSEFACKHCGNITNADINAAKNIMSKGIALNRKREPLGCALVEELNSKGMSVQSGVA